MAGRIKLKAAPMQRAKFILQVLYFISLPARRARVQFTGILPFLLFTLLGGDGGGGGVEFFYDLNIRVIPALVFHPLP